MLFPADISDMVSDQAKEGNDRQKNDYDFYSMKQGTSVLIEFSYPVMMIILLLQK